ncbi:MAG: copper resistance protein CopC [Proteobacteria bacterium]|nr:copper resistance protein CopC [Pseudomonadota bacterium]
MKLGKSLVLMAMVALPLLADGQAPAEAHAFLDHAIPAVGSTLRASPNEVRLWFTEDLEAAFSSVRVVDPSGKRVDRDDKQVDLSDKTLLKVSVPGLEKGSYQVIWRVLSVDGHVTEGDFKFQVAP